MIDGQLRPNKVTDDRVVDAIAAVPRERFVPKGLRGVAYVDEDLEVAPGRFLMEPMVFARLVTAAEPTAADSVLNVGCTTGYSAAVLAQLADAVVALEQDEALVASATEKLAEVGIDNVAVINGRLVDGAAGQGPFSLIFLDGAVERVPEALTDQLADGGRLVCVKRTDGIGRGHLITKVGGQLGGRDLFDASVPLLPGFEVTDRFVF